MYISHDIALAALLDDGLFELPVAKIKKITIIGDAVRNELETIVHGDDPAPYIL